MKGAGELKIAEMISLENRISLVTGATGFIGKQICEILAEMGSEIIAIDTGEIQLNTLKMELKMKYKRKIETYKCNFLDQNELEEVDKIQKEYTL